MLDKSTSLPFESIETLQFHLFFQNYVVFANCSCKRPQTFNIQLRKQNPISFSFVSSLLNWVSKHQQMWREISIAICFCIVIAWLCTHTTKTALLFISMSMFKSIYKIQISRIIIKINNSSNYNTFLSLEFEARSLSSFWRITIDK